MKQLPDDIVLVEGYNELNVQMTPVELPPGEVVLLSAEVPPVLNKEGGDTLPAKIYLRPRADAVAYNLYWRFSPRFEYGPEAICWILSQWLEGMPAVPDYMPLKGEGYYSCDGTVVCLITPPDKVYDVTLEVTRYWPYNGRAQWSLIFEKRIASGVRFA